MDSRTTNATRNIIFGALLKLVQIVVPFIMRTAMIYLMGVEYLGLSSLFASVLQVLNLAELGVGSAMVYNMYKPAADGDKIQICALLKLYKVYYRVIGSVIGVIGVCLTPFIPGLINSGIPNEINIYTLYLLNLAATVLSYWLFAYKNSLLQAHQRVDVVSKVTLITSFLQYGCQLLVLILFKNYYYYVIVAFCTQALTNVITAYYASKLYPEYQPMGNVNHEEKAAINRKIRDLFTSKIGGIVYNSADTLVISSFLGLEILAVYQNYFFILNAIIGVVAIIFQSVTASVGNSIIVESKEKNYLDLEKFTFIICWIAGFCSVSFLCLFQPFMELWVGKSLMLNFSAVICFVVYYYVYELNCLFNLYKDAAGIWHEDRFRPLAASLANLVMNIIFVQFIGIYGVLLSTVLAILLIGMPWLLHNLFSTIFDKEYLIRYLKKLLTYTLIVVISCGVTYSICSLIKVSSWGEVMLKGGICLIFTNALYYIIYRNTFEFNQTLWLANNMTKTRFERIFFRLGMK